MRYLSLAFLLVAPAFSQSFTADDYARAEKFMPYNVNPLVLDGAVRPNWLPDGRFWYRNATADGFEFVLVNPSRATRQPVFPHAALAAALSKATGKTYDATHLPFQTIELNGGEVEFDTDGKHWKCDSDGKACAVAENRKRDRNESLSPDGKRAVFIRDYNLWLRDVATGKETQLTTDGVKDFGYATDNAGWANERPADRVVVARFGKGRDVSTGPARRRRNVSGQHQSGASGTEGVEISAARRSVVTTIQRVVIDVVDPARGALKMPPDQHRSTLCDNIACRGGEWSDVQWSEDRFAASRSFPLRAITGTNSCGSPTRRPARFATCWKKPCRRFRIGQRPRELAVSAGVERNHLVFRSAITGASCISTI